MTILEEFIDYIVYSTCLIVFQQFYGCFYFEQGKRVVDSIIFRDQWCIRLRFITRESGVTVQFTKMINTSRINKG